MVVGMLPAAAFAAETGDSEAPVTAALEGSEVNDETGRVAGPAGDEDVAVMVYGKTMAEALLGITDDFSSFAQALKGELQGILANERLPEVELYLVNSNNEEYRLTPDAVPDASLISSFDIRGKDLGKIVEWLSDISQ